MSYYRKYCQSKNIDDLNTKIKQSGRWLDCAMWSYNGWQLTIIGSFDLSYYHTIEIIAEDVNYIRGKMDWSFDLQADLFVKANVGLIEDLGKVKRLTFYQDGHEVFMVEDCQFSVSFDTVFHYKRDNLEHNERMADWAKD